MVLIKDPRALLGTLRRLRATNDAVIFWNSDESFRVMLRNDPNGMGDPDKDAMGWDLSIIWDSDDDDDDDDFFDEDDPDFARRNRGRAATARAMNRVADLEADGLLEEPGTLVMDQGVVNSLAAAEADPAADSQLVKCMTAVNNVYEYALCPCGKYLIKDGASSCLFCHLTAAPGDLHRQFCAICQAEGPVRHMAQQPCCRQYLHRACLTAWTCRCPVAVAPPPCPLCRGDGGL